MKSAQRAAAGALVGVSRCHPPSCTFRSRWSPRRDGRGVEPIELTSDAWAVEPGRINEIRSSFFDALPSGAAELDSVVIMRNLPLVWNIPRTASVDRGLAHAVNA